VIYLYSIEMMCQILLSAEAMSVELFRLLNANALAGEVSNK